MNESRSMHRQILDAAERLVETLGYDGFSYADVASAVGIRKASIHHHFPTKGDLGRALVGRFRESCRLALAEIDRSARDPSRKLRAYVGLFEATLADGGRMCLCGMLAAGHATLPEPLRADLLGAIADHETWLTAVLKAGRQAGRFRPESTPRTQARALLSGLEGGMLLARAHGEPARLSAVARLLLDALAAEPSPLPAR